MMLSKYDSRCICLLSRDDLDAEMTDILAKSLDPANINARVERFAIHAKTYAMCLESTLKLSTRDTRFGQNVEGWHKELITQWLPRRARQVRCLTHIRQVLAREALPFTFLRGISLAERYYRNPHLRVSGDVDVLVPRGTENKVQEALVHNGFVYRKKNAFRAAQAQFIGQTELIHPSTGTVVDLNWRLTANIGVGVSDIDEDALWDRTSAVAPFEYQVAGEDMLLELIRHAVHGHACEPRLLCKTCPDVAAPLRADGGSLDWHYLTHQACTSNAQVMH